MLVYRSVYFLIKGAPFFFPVEKNPWTGKSWGYLSWTPDVEEEEPILLGGQQLGIDHDILGILGRPWLPKKKKQWSRKGGGKQQEGDDLGKKGGVVVAVDVAVAVVVVDDDHHHHHHHHGVSNSNGKENITSILRFHALHRLSGSA